MTSLVKGETPPSQTGTHRKKSLPSLKNCFALQTAPTSASPSNYSRGPIILELFGGIEVFALALQRWVSDSTAQTGTRQKAKRLSACKSHRCQAFNHQPVSPDPLDTWCINRTAEEVFPLLSPYGSAPATRPCLMVPTGHGPRGPGCPELPRDRVYQEMMPHSLPPAQLGL